MVLFVWCGKMIVTIVLMLQLCPNVKSENSKSWDQTHIINNKRILNNKLLGFSRPTIDIRDLKYKPINWQPEFTPNQMKKSVNQTQVPVTSYRYEPSLLKWLRFVFPISSIEVNIWLLTLKWFTSVKGFGYMSFNPNASFINLVWIYVKVTTSVAPMAPPCSGRNTGRVAPFI